MTPDIIDFSFLVFVFSPPACQQLPRPSAFVACVLIGQLSTKFWLHAASHVAHVTFPAHLCTSALLRPLLLMHLVST